MTLEPASDGIGGGSRGLVVAFVLFVPPVAVDRRRDEDSMVLKRPKPIWEMWMAFEFAPSNVVDVARASRFVSDTNRRNGIAADAMRWAM